MTSSDPRQIPPPPPSRQTPASGSSFFLDLLLDLTVRIEWLEQVIESVPEPQASSGALAILRGWARALHEVHDAIVHVQEHLTDSRFAKLFALDGPLAAFLSRLYGWCEEVTVDFEALAVRLRRGEPVLALFSHKAVSASFREFQELSEALRESLAESRPMSAESRAAWRTFDSDFEELLWATEWMHMSLARGPGT
jgi:hypothetical protein